MMMSNVVNMFRDSSSDEKVYQCIDNLLMILQRSARDLESLDCLEMGWPMRKRLRLMASELLRIHDEYGVPLHEMLEGELPR